MTTERFVTRGSTSLAASIEADDLSITVQSTTRFPTQPEFRIGVGQELMLVTGVSGATWTVTRGIEGTVAAQHLAGTAVVAVLTGGALDEMRAEIEAEDRTASGIRTATTVVAVGAAAAPTAGQVLTATSGTAANWGYPIGFNVPVIGQLWDSDPSRPSDSEIHLTTTDISVELNITSDMVDPTHREV
jgi:hypothetical protein